ncbi:MAG: hypothetical protein D6694_15480 [Gammaproteobacteria bacterium]|nr:MAG: hypothetical protein D6694_15480 [Gammaproteobacteria bacterium]
MHPYATDSKERVNIVVFLALLSVAIAYGIHLVLTIVLTNCGTQWPWWAEAPSVMGVFGALNTLFDKRLWRHKWLHRVGVVKVPDLNGRWSAKGHSSTYNEDFSGHIHIRQTWTHISITMETESSRSHSLTASLLLNQPEGIILSYEYRNEPKPNALPTMHVHRGTAVLRLNEEGQLEGEYYSGRDRMNYGSLSLKRAG